MNVSHNERRNALRFPFEYKIKYSADKEHWFDAITNNISNTGMLFFSQNKTEKKTPLFLEIQYEDISPVVFPVEVVWSSRMPSQEKGFLTGIKFTAHSEEGDQLIETIFNKLASN